MKLFRVAGLFIIAFSVCCTMQAQEDDTLVSDFFKKGEKIEEAKWAGISLLQKNGKKTSLAAYLRDGDNMYADHVLVDLDNDGKEELVLSSFTGGAHCCDELIIYKNTRPGQYQQAGRMFAGHTLITEDNEFIFTFYEPFGYFFTCYACGYVDTTDTAPVDIKTVTLQYKNGKLAPKAGSQELRSIINDNLGKLGEQPYEPLEEDIAQDNGLRKEFAINLAVFYYAFGKNLPETQRLFNKYYLFPDTKKVWAEFVQQLQEIKKGNDF